MCSEMMSTCIFDSNSMSLGDAIEVLSKAECLLCSDKACCIRRNSDLSEDEKALAFATARLAMIAFNQFLIWVSAKEGVDLLSDSNNAIKILIETMSAFVKKTEGD